MIFRIRFRKFTSIVEQMIWGNETTEDSKIVTIENEIIEIFDSD